MRRLLSIVATAAALGAAAGVRAQPSLGLSIGINQPGVYGRINIGDLPPPALVAPQPIVVAPPRERFDRRPIYLYVPPYEQQHWARYCNRYAACGQPVFFVREDWVRERYVHEHPDWGRRHGWHDDRGPGWRDDHDHDRGRRD